jgi:hypothetical protein
MLVRLTYETESTLLHFSGYEVAALIGCIAAPFWQRNGGTNESLHRT